VWTGKSRCAARRSTKHVLDGASDRARKFGTVNRITRFLLMSIDALAGVIAVSLVVVLICHLCPPPDDNSGPGGNAP